MRHTNSLSNLFPKQPPVERFPYLGPFTLSQQKVLEEAIYAALNALLQQQTFNPQTAKEVDITIQLVELLNRMLENGKQIKGFSKAEFQTVVRGGD